MKLFKNIQENLFKKFDFKIIKKKKKKFFFDNYFNQSI